MAEHIKIGEPVNVAETWAFNFLKLNLPANYLVITNVEIPTTSGQLKEVDALVFGDFAIYVLDIKGYTGKLVVDANSWSLDGRLVDNALSKANSISRVYAGRIRSILLREQHAPWCQGMVFVTGQKGLGIEIKKYPENLSIFDTNTIISALTRKEYCTTNNVYNVSISQRRKAIDVLGEIGKIPPKQKSISGFNKGIQIGTDGHIKIFEAWYEQGELKTEWFLKELDTTSPNVEIDLERLEDQATRLEQLAGVLGVPASTPLIYQNQKANLFIRKPRGVPLPEFLKSNPDPLNISKILRFALTSIEQINARGITLCNCNFSDILVSEDDEVTFFCDFLQSENETPQISVKRLFKNTSDFIHDKLVTKWFDNKNMADVEVLKFHLTRLISGVEDIKITDQVEDVIFSKKYELIECLYQTQSSETWKAIHNSGQFNCILEIVNEAESRWAQVQPRISSLMQGFHPSLERIFDIDHLPNKDCYAISRNCLPGSSLEQSLENTNPSIINSWIKQCLQALQYLHNQDLYHGRVLPQNIICNGDVCTLVGISILPDNENRNLILNSYKYHELLNLDFVIEDLRSIWISFLSVIMACNPSKVIQGISDPSLNNIFNIDSIAQVQMLFNEPNSLDFTKDYLFTFKLKNKEIVSVLPQSFKDKWNISSGYMTFLTLDLLNDQRPKSRNQIVLHALRSRRIAGNKINRNSISATISRLKSSYILEDYGKKIRLTNNFLEDWANFS